MLLRFIYTSSSLVFFSKYLIMVSLDTFRFFFNFDISREYDTYVEERIKEPDERSILNKHKQSTQSKETPSRQKRQTTGNAIGT